DKIFTIKDDLPLYPGHGPSTTVEGEQLNPYLHG
ncbi:MAG: MBL fold metallo-hydrolase, partial [Staphylococcus simulans]